MPVRSSSLPSLVIGGLLLLGVYLTSWSSYLLFHSLAEIFSIVVSVSIFLFAWNSLNFVKARYLFVLATAYLFVGCFDLIHMLSYEGMHVVELKRPDVSIQLWLIARFMEAFSLLALPFFFKRRPHHARVLWFYAIVSTLLFLSVVVFPVFPECYKPGAGLTQFKIISEYVICGVLAAAALFLHRRRHALQMMVYWLLMASIGFTIAQELIFTLYTDMYGTANLIGHLLKIISYYLVYRAVLVYGLLNPYKSMFRELENYSHALESRVAERTAALESRNRELKILSRQLMHAEDTERRRIARDLHDSIGQSLSAIKFHVENTVSDIGDRLGENDRMLLNRLVPMIQSAITDVRRIIRNLRPSMLDNLGIMATIDWQCREFGSVFTNIRIKKQLEMADREVPDKLKGPIFRVLQEALNNIGKHSGASSVAISLFQRDGHVCFEIEDDGCGFDPQSTRLQELDRTGMGLAGMKERLELSGALFTIDSAPGRGTRVSAIWPLSGTS